jgi:hypothetical protein
MPEEIKAGGLNCPKSALDLEQEKIKKGICPFCDGTLAFQEGCKTCFSCGWGGCSV